MDRETPTPPATIPEEVIDELRACDATTLEAVGTFVRELAEHRESDQEQDEDARDDSPEDETQENRPEGVPGRATVTVKEINDNQYYYWQWRDGDTVTSKYKGPVNSAE